MLCYVAVAAMLVNKFFGDADTNKTLSLEGVNGVLGIILGWLASNLDWAVLIQTILVILPAWLLFRYAPKHPRHTLVEGFFIQAFMGSLVLICIMLRALISDKVLSLIPVIYYIAYRQLFGYGIWATLWRTLLTLGIILYFFAVLMMAVKYFQGDFSEVQSTGISLVMVGILFAAGIAVFLLGWWIGKRTESKG